MTFADMRHSCQPGGRKLLVETIFNKRTDVLNASIKDERNPVAGSTATSKKAGHNSIVRSPDGSEWFTAYTTKTDGRYMSRMGFREDGSLYVNGPIKGYQVMPSGATKYENYAVYSEVTASSTKMGYRPEAVIDGEIGIYSKFEQYEWASGGEREGAWVKLAWDKPVLAEYILLYDSAENDRALARGRIVLNEDPNQVISDIPFPSAPGEPAVIRLDGKPKITSLQFIAAALVDPEGSSGLSEIVVLGKRNNRFSNDD